MRNKPPWSRGDSRIIVVLHFFGGIIRASEPGWKQPAARFTGRPKLIGLMGRR